MDGNEKIIFSNSFGTVSDKRIIVSYKNGSEDFPLKQISSVSFERKQNIPLAIIYFIVGVGLLIYIFSLSQVPGAIVVVGAVLFIFTILVGLAYYVGHYQIKLSVVGKDRKPIKVEVAKAQEGKEFADAIRHQLIS